MLLSSQCQWQESATGLFHLLTDLRGRCPCGAALRMLDEVYDVAVLEVWGERGRSP